MIKTLLKGQYGSNRIVPNSNILKIFETEKKLEGFLETLSDYEKDNVGQTILSLIPVL